MKVDPIYMKEKVKFKDRVGELNKSHQQIASCTDTSGKSELTENSKTKGRQPP